MINEQNIYEVSSLKTKEEVFAFIAKEVKNDNAKVDETAIVEGFNAREAQSSTGFEHGVAIPHTKVKNLGAPKVIIVRDLNVSWPAMDKQVTEIAIAIMVDADSASNEHLDILANLSRKLVDETFIKFLKTGNKAEIVHDLADLGPQQTEAKASKGELVLAVTACPTGIAHTFMAAENIQKTGEQLGYQVKVETRGQAGAQNMLTEAEIKAAKAIIVACDVDVPTARFDGKKVLKVSVKEGVHEPERLFASLDDLDVYHEQADNQEEETNEFSFYKSLMTGVTHMLPFTIAGGILIALRFFFGTPDDIAAGLIPIINAPSIGQFFGDIGGILFGLMLPVLAAYIAYSIGDRAAIMPGFLTGMMASTDGSGFLGAIVGGFVAGFVAKALVSNLKNVTKSLQGSYQILFIPVLAAIIVGAFMKFFGLPIAWLNNGMTEGLKTLQTLNPILLGALVGAMMASDMGGPINKAAYVTGTVLLSEGNQEFMAAVMAGGMVPPLAIALSTVIHKNKYTQAEREAGKTNWILGCSFITEGAIPFAAADPKHVIPALMLGSGTAGALSMLFKVSLPAPHGGIFVFPLVGNVGFYMLSIIVGTIIGALMLGALKKGEK